MQHSTNSGRKKVLWLASWYPNRFDRFDGDFIQRHARAASLYNDIHVIVVKEGDIQQDVEEDWNKTQGLTEQIIYFRTRSRLLKKVEKQLKWRRLYLAAINNYIKKNGRPATVHIHVPWKAGLIALELKKRYNLNYIVTEHWGIYNDILHDNYERKAFYIKYLLKKIFENALQIISPSFYLAQAINQIVVPTRFTIIPNVVDTTLFYHKREKHSKFTFIHVSNMVPLKNVGGILQAFHHVVTNCDTENIQLILVGNKDNEYVKVSEALGLLNKNVFFKGEISYSEVAREMQLSHCFVLNSNMENSPCVIGEALCCGLPVITTKVGGIPELVDESNSLFVKENDEKDLAEALIKIYQNYGSYDLQAIAEKAKKKFSYANISALHTEIYNHF